MRTAASTVQADINYLGEPPSSDPSLPLQYGIVDKARTTMRSTPHRMTLTDARAGADDFHLDRQGFCRVPHRTAIGDFRDPADVARHQPREIEELVCAVTGAYAAFGVGPQLRFVESLPEGDARFDARPARFAHADFSDESIYWFAKRWQGIRIADYPRFAAFNVWRVLTPPPQDVPLALCDAATVKGGDETDALAIIDRSGVAEDYNLTTVYRYNPAHKWYYFGDMSPEEVVIFKAYDSDPSRAHRTPHTAFNNPLCPPGTPPRVSAEVRVLAVFA